jgi:hypothetical protein
MPSELLTKYLPNLSPVIRFIRMDAIEPAWAFRSAAIFRQILNLDAGRDTYRGGIAGGFDVPDDAKHRWQINFDGMPEGLDVRLNATHAYVYAFASRERGLGGDPHPARGFRLIKSGQWDALMRAVEAHLGIGRYPAWLPMDTETFHKIKLSGPVNLRCVPRTDNNVPTVATVKELFVSEPIYPPDKPIWRQGIFASGTHWLELA